MCGLAGIFSDSLQCDLLKSKTEEMLNIARHRGPDDQGIFSNRNCAIGLNRLSIIDLETGHQPIVSEDGNLVLVCNGEIYNYKQLKSELKQKNHVFRTNSDVEVIIHLFEQEGVESFQRLDGMFAFALLDVKTNQLYLCRDRVGIKPLYYIRENEDTIYFASEIKSLHRVSKDRTVNAEILAEYLMWGYSISGSSVWEKIDIVPPGSYLKISDHTHRISSYIDDKPVEYFEDSEIAIKELRNAVIQDIESQLMSDVPLGVFLSGGIDSSIIVGVISKLMDLRIPTFSIDFPSEQFSESDKIKKISGLYNTDHHSFMAKSNLLDLLNDVVKACDEPFGDPAALPTHLLAKKTRKYVTVALSGDGSDEFMYGYNYSRQVIESVFSIRKKWLHSMVKSLSFNHPGYYSLLSRTADGNGKPRNIYDLMRSRIFKLSEDNLSPKYNDLSAFDRHSYLPNNILYKTDRMTMYNSLEVRVPFLGNCTIDTARRIPKSFQVDNYMQKILLRKAFDDLLPPKIIDQPKHGFRTPVGEWIKESYSESKFNSLFTRSFISELTHLNVINRIIRENFQGRFDHGRFIYRILVAIKWANEYKPSNLKYE